MNHDMHPPMHEGQVGHGMLGDEHDQTRVLYVLGDSITTPTGASDAARMADGLRGYLR